MRIGKAIRSVVTAAILGCAALAQGQEKSFVAAAGGPNLLTSPDGRTFVGRLAPHEPIYFLYGDEDPVAKFQFSFKYRLFYPQNENKAGRKKPSLNIAYTQRSLWDIEGDSSPFYDTAYMPEIILESARPTAAEGETGFTWFGFQAALRHESNGRSGVASRSLDRAYVRPVLALGPLDDWHVVLAPVASVYVTELTENPDLPDYRGYGELRGAIQKGDGMSLGFSAIAGKDFDRMTYQFDLTIPVQIDVLNLAAYFHAQYFEGYGESLLSYKEKSDVWRFGISLVR